jgi:hypothetical protein
MQPFFSYYGGKWKLAKRIGAPQYNHVIEPFAGAAGYSTFWEPKKVTLIELNPVIYGVWKYLQGVPAAELMRLPSNISHVDELPSRVCQEAKWLIGFWFNTGMSTPGKSRCDWARTPCLAASYWSETIKSRLASQVDRIRHWTIIEGSWEQAPDDQAHWHIDPPYKNAAGRLYRCNQIDYSALEKWCKRRRGFVQVCENDGATWLPFKPFSIVKTHRARGYSVEALYEATNHSQRGRHSAAGHRHGRRAPVDRRADLEHPTVGLGARRRLRGARTPTRRRRLYSESGNAIRNARPSRLP